MALRLFNSGSGRKEQFKPLKSKTVSLYVCGITPYDTTHLGHAFTYITSDALVRYLKFKGFAVNYTQNVTDIDDDILKRAKKEKKGWVELGDIWTKRYITDIKSINILRSTHYVKATDSIPRIIAMVSKLRESKFAYQSGGNVYFDIKKFPKYGQLSHYTEKRMKILLKERGGDPKDPNKKNPLDFILWQGAKEGEPSWKTPWGKGRPGWHIECSAMINQYLGKQIDIHGGGKDLIFPHHESEIAQSESFTGKSPFVGYFMHAAMVEYEGEKMSKSLGNLVMISELIKTHSPNAIRWMLLSHHYRAAWEYTAKEMKKADNYSRMIDKIKSKTKKTVINKSAVDKFVKIMDNDLDTPAALELIAPLLKKGDASTARFLLGVLGFFI